MGGAKFDRLSVDVMAMHPDVSESTVGTLSFFFSPPLLRDLRSFSADFTAFSTSSAFATIV